MKNIFDIMKEFGIEVPEDHKKDFEKAVLENYKTMADYDKQTEKLNKANDTIKVSDTAMRELLIWRQKKAILNLIIRKSWQSVILTI